ncbi:hypothetical protein GYMLUDRAFT_249138 [Collybiopsis luxurians FD-317 M1]|uniref:Uncharacterized protein n=1 Tax=Collybiopsis luxurians FD-317 M1 TaxID=944289 RepID=A0A0D0CJ06_9AGAR|nr:hypothetical protein GYMLUDRAFT_249138 [Collybiopsis luxurians FD-317 M1]
MAEAQAHQHAFEKLMVVQSEGYWAKAERSLPRGTQTGQAPHTLNEHKQYLHEKSVTDEISQKSKEATNFQNYFGVKEKPQAGAEMQDVPAHIRDLARRITAQKIAVADFSFAHTPTQNPNAQPLPDLTGFTPGVAKSPLVQLAMHMPHSNLTSSNQLEDAIVSGSTSQPPKFHSHNIHEPAEDLAFDGYLSDCDESDPEGESGEDVSNRIHAPSEASRKKSAPILQSQVPKR